MDNVSHSLIGALVGEAIARNTLKELPLAERRQLFVPTLAIGNNLPDLDLLYTALGQGKLTYLLHHRGHTHTIVGALLLSALLFLALRWSWRRRGLTFGRAQHRALLGAVVLGPLLHLAMDVANSYGVHPFWPFYNGWMYGDSVFIIEPLFWTAATPLSFLLATRSARMAVQLSVIAGIVLCFATQMVPIPIAAAFVLVTAAMAYAGYRLPPPAAVLVGITVWLTVTAIFVFASHLAGVRIRSLVAQELGDAQLLDDVRTPTPVNPFCWEVMLVQSEGADHFAVRRALLSLAPNWLPVSACPDRGARSPTTAPLHAVPRPNTAGWEWHGELVMPRAQLREAARRRCEARVLLQFARVPWVVRSADAWTMGDLRYDRESALGFADITVSAHVPERCPWLSARWVEPRRDLLR